MSIGDYRKHARRQLNLDRPLSRTGHEVCRANHPHRYAAFGLRTQRLRLPPVAALFPTKAIETGGEVLAGLTLRPLEKREKIRPNRIRRGSPEQRRSAVQSPERTWRAVSEGRMGEAKPFENTTISAPRWAPVCVRNRDDGGGDGPAVQPSPPDPYRGSGALQRVATFAAIFKRLRPKPLRRQASGKEVTHRPVQQSEWTVGNGHGVNCLAGSQFLHRGRSKAGP